MNVRLPISVRLKRAGIALFVAAYLGVAGFFLYSHVIGDSARFTAGYFWTWDMFPNYPSFSARRMAIGRTTDGDSVQIFPTDLVQFRRGANGDYTRFDLPRNDAKLRDATEQALKAGTSPGDAAIRYVFLVEQYWPSRFNLPDDLYRAAYGEDNPRFKSWRIIDEGPPKDGGAVRWISETW